MACQWRNSGLARTEPRQRPYAGGGLASCGGDLSQVWSGSALSAAAAVGSASLESGRTSSTLPMRTRIGVAGTNSAASLDKPGMTRTCCTAKLSPRRARWRRRWPGLFVVGRMRICWPRRKLPEKSSRRMSVCAKTIVASMIPRMNRTWKVVVIPEDVVAMMRSSRERLAYASSWRRP